MSQHNTQGRQGQGARRRYNKGGRSYGNDRRDSSGYRPKYRKEAPAKLSLWQRFLGLFGIRPSKNNKHAARDKAAAKTNTRVARNRQDRVSAPNTAWMPSRDVMLKAPTAIFFASAKFKIAFIETNMFIISFLMAG